MRMNGIRVFFAIAVFVVGLSGCSQEGNLVVKNEGASQFQGYVENQSVIIDPGASYSTSVYIGKSLAIVGPSDIGIIIKGASATKKTFSDEIWIKSDETSTYRLIDDVGACNFTNAHFLGINGIQIKRCADAAFGPNLLEKNHTIAPGTTRLIQFDPGCWDILVNYGRLGLLDTVSTLPIGVGKILDIAWVPGYVYTPPSPSPAR
jgi:hypothetical protein